MTDHEQEGYELFRRAILERDAQAWAEIHRRYRPLLMTWAYRSSARLQTGEGCDDIADQALARAWAALTPERFAEFASLARLLSYLRSCVASTAIDCARAEASSQRATSAADVHYTATPEQIVLADIDRADLWRRAIELTAGPAERVVLIESFALDLPPRSIHTRHPQLFADVADVYSVKRNLFARLQRNRDMLRLGLEYRTA
jgi:hypothetical protein